MRRSRIVGLALMLMGFLAFRPLPLFAQESPYNYAAIDAYALSAPREAASSVAALSAYLTGPAKNDREKARAIFRWITANISYDAALYFSGRADSADTSAAGVLRSRRSICEGYATLLLELAQASGLSAVKISGFAKGFSYTTGVDDEAQNHSWNAVKIEGRWMLLDSTWGAGFVADRSFQKKFEGFFFFPPPEQLIFSHFPADPRWQLLDHPLERAEFFRLVTVKPAFFENHLQLDSHREAVIRVKDRVAVSLIVPPEATLRAQVIPHSKSVMLPEWPLTSLSRKGNRETIQAVFPAAGAYTLRVFGGRSRERLDQVLEYEVEAESGAGDAAGFPISSPEFAAYGLTLDNHPEPLIKTGAELTVSLKAPPEVRFLAVLKHSEQELRKSLVQIERDGERALVRVKFPKPGLYHLSLFAKRESEPGGYAFVLEYLVQASAGAGEAAGFPETSDQFAALGLKLVSHQDPIIKTGAELTLSLVAPPEVALLARLQQGGRELRDSLALVLRDGDRAVIRVRFPAAGVFNLMIFGKRAAESGSYAYLLQYEVRASEGLGEAADFPKTSPDFSALGLKLDSHDRLLIRCGQELAVTLQAPPDMQFMAVLEQGGVRLPDDRVEIKREGNRVQFNVKLPAPGPYRLTIYAKHAAEPGNTYHYAVEYRIVAGGNQ